MEHANQPVNNMRLIQIFIFGTMKTSNVLFPILGGLLSASILFGCASSTPEPNNDEVRARAHAAYDEMDGEAPKTTQAPANGVSAVPDGETLLGAISRASCPDASFLRGQGIADDLSSALVVAQKDISSQIQSALTAKSEMAKSQSEDALGKEVIQSSYSMEAQVLTRLENAQDAKATVKMEQNGKFGVVACMSRADAAKPFQDAFTLLQDSVITESKIFAEQNHPMQKINAYKQGKSAFVQLLSVSHVLESLNLPMENKAKDAFVTMQQGYNDFYSQYAFYFQQTASENPTIALQNQLLFERMSKNYSVRNSACNNGLNLVAEISPASCGEGSLGISCSAEINMSGTSCQGEPYFNLHAKVKGNGRYDEKEAMDRLNKNISSGDWFNEWQNELNKWRIE